jgi:hypothetical protein
MFDLDALKYKPPVECFDARRITKEGRFQSTARKSQTASEKSSFGSTGELIAPGTRVIRT